MRDTVLFTTWGSRGRLDNLARSDIQVDIPGERSVSDIFKLASQHMIRLHRQIRMFALQRLHSGQLIRADRSFSLGGSLGGLCIDLAPLDDLLFPLGVFLLG
jgi:hypothetical protein